MFIDNGGISVVGGKGLDVEGRFSSSLFCCCLLTGTELSPARNEVIIHCIEGIIWFH